MSPLAVRIFYRKFEETKTAFDFLWRNFLSEILTDSSIREGNQFISQVWVNDEQLNFQSSNNYLYLLFC